MVLTGFQCAWAQSNTSELERNFLESTGLKDKASCFGVITARDRVNGVRG